MGTDPPGTRFGTAIELHSDEFSLSFFAFTNTIAIVLTTTGLVLRMIGFALVRRIRLAG